MPARHPLLDRLASSPVLWRATLAVPTLFPGPLLHQAALWAAWEGALPEAERLFEAAVLRYRVQLDVVPLARLRVHQLIARARAAPRRELESVTFLEIERRLCRLERIEAPWPPFALVDASSLLATWLEDQTPAPGAPADALEPGHPALDAAA